MKLAFIKESNDCKSVINFAVNNELFKNQKIFYINFITLIKFIVTSIIINRFKKENIFPDNKNMFGYKNV